MHWGLARKRYLSTLALRSSTGSARRLPADGYSAAAADHRPVRLLGIGWRTEMCPWIVEFGGHAWIVQAKENLTWLTALVIVRVLWMPQLFTNPRGTMADFTEVLKELQHERSKLDQAIRAIGELVGHNHAGGIQAKGDRPRRTVSAAARSKMAAAQRARWAKAKGAAGPATVRTMSQSARKKIAAAQRARWAKVRARQKKAA
jgi:hypothetical protein